MEHTTRTVPLPVESLMIVVGTSIAAGVLLGWAWTEHAGAGVWSAVLAAVSVAGALTWRLLARSAHLAGQATARLRESESEARKARARLETYRAALDRHAIVAITDQSGVITEVNDNFCRISGYGREELIGAKHSIVNSGEHPKSFWADMWRSICSNSDYIWRAEVCNRAKDGSLYWVDTTIGPLRGEDGKVVGFISIRFDITDRKQAEALLQYSHDNLERHVAERTSLLAEAVEAAESASNAKSEFLAHMSHEIRTPINGVAGMLDLLSGTRLDDQQRRYVELGTTSVNNLTSIINDVLDFSKIEAGKLDIVEEDFDLLTLIEDVVQMLACRAQQKGLDLSSAVEPLVPRRVHGDPARVRQILINLAGNAIKFTQKGRVALRVVLEDAAGPGGGTLVRFTVSDTGIGIPAESMPRLFKAFSQADSSTTRDYGGTGLGLVISKKLATLMGGRIGAESEPGRGSTFWFTIAFGAATTPPEERSHEAAGLSLAGRRVLLAVADDSPGDQLREQLCAWGMLVETTDASPEYLGRLSEPACTVGGFDIALLDSRLTDGGSAAAERIRSSLGKACPPLLLMHPLATPLDPRRLREEGYAGSVATPPRQSDLLDTLVSVLAPGAAEVAVDPVAARPSPPPGGRRAAVLVAEDNEINQIVAREILMRAGFDCDVVGNGRLAVDAIMNGRSDSVPYDLVLMDCQMPVMDGFEATREIRRLERSCRLTAPGRRRLPVIALTANTMQGDRDRCIDAGMDAHASKPIHRKSLLETIERVLREAQEGARAA